MYYYGNYGGGNCGCNQGNYGYAYPNYGGYGYGNNGGYGASIVLVLFILLVIIIGCRSFNN